MITLDPRNGRPIYEQVKEGFCRLIVSGALAQGEKMPSVRQLAAQLAINPNTIQRAYAQLEAEGSLVSYPGKGSFVAPNAAALQGRRQQLTATLQQTAAELLQMGLTHQQLVELLTPVQEGTTE